MGGAKNFHMDGRKKETFKVALYLNFINLWVWDMIIWRLLLLQGAPPDFQYQNEKKRIAAKQNYFFF